jgi:hypothetical protein
MNKEVHEMNINLNNNYFPDLIASRGSAQGGRDVIIATPATKNDLNISQKEIELKRQILEETTMDINEIKNFLFMLIGSEIKLKPESEATGKLVNRMV